jgi:hypothetical protein
MRNIGIYGATLLILAMLSACTRTIRRGAIIDAYNAAECIPVQFGPGISPPTRAWDYSIATRQGITVRVSGAEMPGGRIDVRYLPDGTDIVAADAGDYIYPADVRLDRSRDKLYSKASGIPAAFGGPQTWLYEFDLNSRQQIGRARVDPTVLTKECQVK